MAGGHPEQVGPIHFGMEQAPDLLYNFGRQIRARAAEEQVNFRPMGQTGNLHPPGGMNAPYPALWLNWVNVFRYSSLVYFAR